MPIRICDRCQNRYMVNDKHIVDHVHDCAGATSEALQNEDVLVIGGFQDFTGSQGVNAQQVFYQGAVNQFFGQRAEIEGEDFEGVTSRGKSSATHRTRNHLAYKRFK